MKGILELNKPATEGPLIDESGISSIMNFFTYIFILLWQNLSFFFWIILNDLVVKGIYFDNIARAIKITNYNKEILVVHLAKRVLTC